MKRGVGGHGGGDQVLLNDIFGIPDTTGMSINIDDLEEF